MSDAGVNLRPSVLVLGGGAAGLCAAGAVRRAGLSAVVIEHGGGATALSSGAVDVADAARHHVPGPTVDPLHRGPTWVEGMETLASQRPRHPYARLGPAARSRITEALELLDELAEGLELEGRADENLVVATQLGTTKRTARVPRASALDLSELVERSDSPPVVAVLDLGDLAGFDGSTVARMLDWIVALGARQLTPVVVEVPAVLGAKPAASPVRLAQALDDEGRLALFCGAVASALQSLDPPPAAALIPPVLGVHAHRRAREALEASAAIPVVELLALPQSAPGARLLAALRTGTSDRGAELVRGRATSAVVEDGQVRSVSVTTIDGAELSLSPGAVVLATGRFLSGGLERDGSSREVVFGLPVVADGRVVGDRFIGELTADHPDADHAIFRAGVPWDDELRPRSLTGEALAGNLFAAGSVLEGYDPARDGSGLGVAALTGLLAGERAAKVAETRGGDGDA